MCSSKTKLQRSSVDDLTPTAASHMNGRPVLQPNCNRAVPTTTTTITTILDRRNSLKNASKPLQPLSSPPNTTTFTTKTKPSASTPPASPKLKSPRPPAVKRGNDPNHALLTKKEPTTTTTSVEKKSKPCVETERCNSLKYSSSLIVEAPGSIAAARREQVAIMQVQRKMRIAHYGRTKSANYQRSPPSPPSAAAAAISITREDKRCNFITSNSDPIYVAYHDEEWGVPVHDDKMLFELLVLTGAQVGSDWTSVLKKRQDFRDAFSDFDAEIVSKYTEKKITSVSAYYGIEVSLVRGVVDNSNSILEIKKKYGSFDKYLWGFVNHKPIATQYKWCNKIPVKTSKSESISKDMVRRGFRLVGPTVIHSFMQAAGLTNDHLIACPRHLQCVELASQPTPMPMTMPCVSN